MMPWTARSRDPARWVTERSHPPAADDEKRTLSGVPPAWYPMTAPPDPATARLNFIHVIVSSTSRRGGASDAPAPFFDMTMSFVKFPNTGTRRSGFDTSAPAVSPPAGKRALPLDMSRSTTW